MSFMFDHKISLSPRSSTLLTRFIVLAIAVIVIAMEALNFGPLTVGNIISNLIWILFFTPFAYAGKVLYQYS
jgi:hypothetical protein